MPELKRIFQAGVMNRDLDDRLLPAGQYRAALNVNIGRSEGSDIGAIENLLGNELIASNDYITNGTVIGVYRDNGNERIYFFVTNNTSADESNPETAEHAIYEYSQNSQLIRRILFHNDLNFHVSYKITGINLVDDLMFWTDNRNEPRKINIDLTRNDPQHYIPATGHVLDDQIALAKHAPYTAPMIASTGSTNVETGEEITSNFLEDKLVRFAYRWKFEDAEYSTISPFSTIVFNSGADNITAAEIEQITDVNEVRSFINTIKSVSLNIPTPTGFGITEVELVYKEVGSQTIYIAEAKPVTGGQQESFVYNSQDPFRAIPGDQITRVYDAIPRVARTQEVAGNRIVFGDYLQNYNVPEIDFRADVVSSQGHDRFPRHSVKSRRTYQVGIVLADKQGRQTPVILSSAGNDTVFVPNTVGGVDAALKNLSITFENKEEIPDWAYSYRVVIKQREQEYYNWFSGPEDGHLTRSGDGINKIPIDQTALVDAAAEVRPSARSVYFKVPTTVNNDQFRVTAIDQAGLVRDTTLTGGTVFETVPVASNLDIFFETSTGGTVASIPNDPVPIDFFNCYLVNYNGNNIEANRLRMGFNEPAFDVGVKAYLVQENFEEERRFNTLIHSSGVFNNRTGFNQINQFNEAEGGITVSLDPSDGSIQLVYAEDTQLIIFQEDKISRSPIDKDFIYSAEGGAIPVTSNTQYLGTIAPYPGEYGISKDPRSFAVYGQNKYFTDKNRGVVLRLNQQGIQEISKNGLADFYRDVFRTSSEIVGSFDEYSDTYNLTIEGTGYASQEDTNVATASDRFFTVSFEEDVQGWSSFKSFKQEAGLTLNNRYYTFSGGQLWRHNSETVDRNSFYGSDPYESYVDIIFNDNPSLVKEFKTLGYEGTEGWECEYVETDLDSFGNLPVVDTAYSVTLQISGNVGNGSITGEQVFIEAPGTDLKWTVIASPVSSLYEFNTITDVTLTTTDPDVTIQEPTQIVNGNLVFEVDYTVGNDNAIVPVTIGGNADARFEVSLLIVNADDQVTNASISPRISRFTQSDKDDPAADNVVITLTPDVGYRIDTPDPTVTIEDDSILGTPVFNRADDLLTITIPATIPNEPTITGLTVSGNAVIDLILTLATTNANTTYTSTASPTSIMRFDPETATITLQLNVVGEFILGQDDINVIANIPGFVVSEPTINADESEATYTVTYTGEQLLDDTTVTFAFTGDLTVPFIRFEVDGDEVTLLTTESNEADDLTADVITNTGGVNTVVTSDSAWLTAVVTGDEIEIQAAAVALEEAFEFDGGFRTGTLTATSSDARFPSLEAELDVRQRGNAYWVIWDPIPGTLDADAIVADELVLDNTAYNTPSSARNYAFVAPSGTNPTWTEVGTLTPTPPATAFRLSPDGVTR